MHTTMTQRVYSLEQLDLDVDGIKNQVVEWRRYLHRRPELSFEEYETSQYIFDVLSSISGITVSRPTPTSVVARLTGGKPGKVIAVRADIDALPIEEESEVDYRSTVKGKMHACGHDGHTAILLGLATVLAPYREQVNGELVFMFQHAEELSPGGAQQMVDAGVMDGVDEVIGLHLWSGLPVGLIGLLPGPAMAAPDTFQCTIIGQGGHAAWPHETVDPIAIAAQVVTALQQIVSRQVDPLDPCVISVAQFIAGTTFNVIPNSAYISGTVRTFDAELRKQIPVKMERLIKGITEGFGASYEFDYELGYRPVNNDPDLTSRLESVVKNSFGSDTLFRMRPSMAGEDFSAYQQKAPGVFAFIGAGNEDMGINWPHHHPRFDVDETSLHIGLRYYISAVYELLGK